MLKRRTCFRKKMYVFFRKALLCGLGITHIFIFVVFFDRYTAAKMRIFKYLAAFFLILASSF